MKKIIYFILIELLFINLKCYAEVPVIFKEMPYYSTEQYLKMLSVLPPNISLDKNELNQLNDVNKFFIPKKKDLSLDNTSLLLPGRVQTQIVDLPWLTQPIFIIGSDSGSIRWLKHYKNRLKTIGAIGIVTNTPYQSDLDAIKQIAEGIILLPISADIIRSRLHITYYPVLISKNAIEQ